MTKRLQFDFAGKFEACPALADNMIQLCKRMGYEVTDAPDTPPVVLIPKGSVVEVTAPIGDDELLIGIQCVVGHVCYELDDGFPPEYALEFPKELTTRYTHGCRRWDGSYQCDHAVWARAEQFRVIRRA